MLITTPLAILLLSITASGVATPYSTVVDEVSHSIHAAVISSSDTNALRPRQITQNLWAGYRAKFLWSAAIVSNASQVAPTLDMRRFYTNVKAKAEHDMVGYSLLNPGKQPRGTWEYYEENLHFTMIAPNEGDISFELMSYALSTLGMLTARGWTQHFTAVFYGTGGRDGLILINVEATNSGDGVVADTLFRGYDPPRPSSGHPQILNSHNDVHGKLI